MAWKRAVEAAFGHRPHYLMAVRGRRRSRACSRSSRSEASSGGRALVSVPYAVYGGICAERAGRAGTRSSTPPPSWRAGVGAGYVELRHRAGQEMDAADEVALRDVRAPHLRLRGGEPRGHPAEAAPDDAAGRRSTASAPRSATQHLDAFYEIYAHERAQPRLAGLPAAALPRARRRVRQGVRAAHGLAQRPDGRRRADAPLRGPGAALLRRRAAARRSPTRSTTSCTGSSCATSRGAGYRVFDFGRSREGTGPYNFKRHWGFEPQPLPVPVRAARRARRCRT